MKLSIAPFKRVGPIEFGMSVKEVHQVLGNPTKSFMKSSDSKFPADAFQELGIYVYYKPPGTCGAVELAAPSLPTFQDVSLLERPYKDILNFVKNIDPELEIEESGFTSYMLGIGVYSPSAEEFPEEVAESVVIFDKGYYS